MGHSWNRLAQETSPYLRQHAGNPVDWYPWGEEAFARARAEDKPIFLSIGYSACHWCHVMERESFESEAIARLMNEHFVCIKVDREERPDVDEVYMKAVQALTRGGGWPMSVWLTPDLEPFFGGTYFPPEDRFGRAGFPRVLNELARLWREERPRVLASAKELTEHLRGAVADAGSALAGEDPAAFALDPALLPRAAEQLLRAHDDVNGGFGGAPKFPHPTDLQLLLRIDARLGHPAARAAALLTLSKMAAGGIHDQLAGGFHRYSVDERWLIPHFEKMLYDNALLAGAYLDAFLLTGEPAHAEVVRSTLEWALREMRVEGGGFASATDADSEGEEGKYFAWTPGELAAALGEDDAAWVGAFWDVTDAGNFEHGRSVLWRRMGVAEFAAARQMPVASVAAGLEAARRRLLAERGKRVAPARDDKVLADWNGLMIAALARASFHLREPRYVEAAAQAAAFLRAQLWSEEGGGRLLRVTREGVAKNDANLADFAFLIDGLLELWHARFDPADLAWARRLADLTLERFEDREQGGFWFTAHDAEKLLLRSKESWDGATPAGASVHAMNLVRLAALTGEERYRAAAQRQLAFARAQLERIPQGLTRLLAAVDFVQAGAPEIVLVGPGRAALEPFLDVLRDGLAPNRVVIVATPETRAEVAKLTPLLEGREAALPTAWVCRDGACRLPVTTPEGLAQQLR